MKEKLGPKKYAILETCYNIMVREGFEKVTLKRIGAEHGVAPSLVMHYFKNKQELFEDLVDFMVEKMSSVYLEEIESFDTYEEKLNFYLDKVLSLFVAQTVDDLVFYGCFYKGLIDEAILKRFREMYDRDLKISQALIRGYLDEKGIKGRNVKHLAVHLMSSIEGLNLYHAIFNDGESFNNLAGYFKNAFIKILNEGID